ncbi:serine/threonine-protein kinase [Phytomonospora sp. NPDC050363]|uniref:serine/threonine-protein kinase n=1 Tax=Phytomonospora sp. NPDC050363 TaxID=3155642 RepID=UPI0033C5DB9D
MTQGTGHLVGGRYRLERRLRSGGFGHVWKARDLQLDVDVAAKQVQIPPGIPDGERAERIARAAREARNAAKLRDHPNVVPVHDVVVDGGAPWIIMRLVRGDSLADRLSQRGPLSVAEAMPLARGLLRALDAAHEQGILHRDVKPDNVMLTESGEVLLTDFGTAVHLADTPVTLAGVLIGTPEYTAPERLLGAGDRPVSDVFSLGATLYHAIEGTSPFHRDTHVSSMTAVLHDRPRTPRRAGALGGLVARMLEKDPDQRPTVTQARNELRAAAGGSTKSGKRDKREKRAARAATKLEPRPTAVWPKTRPEWVAPPAPPTPKPVAKPPAVRPKSGKPVPKPPTPRPAKRGLGGWVWLIVIGVVVLAAGSFLWNRSARDAAVDDCVYQDGEEWLRQPCGWAWSGEGNYRVFVRIEDDSEECPSSTDEVARFEADAEEPSVTLCLAVAD